MPVLAKFCGIVIRLLMGPTIGTRLHAFHGNAEVIIGFNPVRIIQSDAPPWVEAEVLGWARYHEQEFRNSWGRDALPMPQVLGGTQGRPFARS